MPTGSTGCIQDSTGAGVLTINPCVGTPPVTLSASTTTGTSILTLTQSGLGYALTVNGTTDLVSGSQQLFFSGTGLNALATVTLSSNTIVQGTVGGTHGQSFGTGDSVTFAGIVGPHTFGTTVESTISGALFIAGSGLTVPVVSITPTSGSEALTVNGNFVVNGSSTLSGAAFGSGGLSGTHAQNVGTGDGPTFAGIVTTSGSNSMIYIGSSGNFYDRTFSGTPSCSGVTDGWTGYDTGGDHLWICNGGVAKSH